MALKKQYLKSKPVAKVTFRLSPDVADGGKKAYVVGDFNNWKTNATPMQELKDGSFKVTMDLESGRDYQYRYLIDGERWTNDGDADRYEYSEFGGTENCVVSV